MASVCNTDHWIWKKMMAKLFEDEWEQTSHNILYLNINPEFYSNVSLSL